MRLVHRFSTRINIGQFEFRFTRYPDSIRVKDPRTNIKLRKQ